MNSLNNKIADILKQHPEGEPFFDALDLMIRSDLNILDSFMHFVHTKVFNTKEVGVILSGNFGNAIFSIYGTKLFQNFGDVILVNGGIRKGEKPIIFKNTLPIKSYIFLDDSFYSGKTMREISNALKLLGGTISRVFVIYDGSKEKIPEVNSMFRYYDEYHEPSSLGIPVADVDSLLEI